MKSKRTQLARRLLRHRCGVRKSREVGPLLEAYREALGDDASAELRERLDVG